MNAQTYLSQIGVLDYKIKSNMRILHDLETMAESSHFALDGVKVSHSRNNHPMEDAVIKIEEMKARIGRDLIRLCELKEEITEKIQEIPDMKLQQVLEMRYVSLNTWEEIADTMDRTVSSVYKLHALGLAAMK